MAPSAPRSGSRPVDDRGPLVTAFKVRIKGSVRFGSVCLLLVVGVLIAACGAVINTPRLPAAPVCASGQIDGELVLMSKTDQVSPQVIDDFERRYGINVVFMEYESEDELLAMVTAGAAAVDVLVIADYLTAIMRRGDALFPLDRIALPGLMNLDPTISGITDDSGPFYSVPLVWGTVGIGINLNMVGRNVDPSWGLLLDVGQTWVFAGRVSFLEERRQVMAAAMLYQGDSPNLDDRRKVLEAGALVAEARNFIRGFDSEDYADDLVEGGLDVAHGRSDKILTAFPANSSDFRYIIPREGAVIWLENLVIPTTSLHPCTAHSFIDFILEPRFGAEVANHAGAATPNVAALGHVIPELAANPLVYPPSEVRSRLEILDYSEDLNRLYTEGFLQLEPS